MSENAQQTTDKPSEAIPAPDQLIGVDLAQDTTPTSDANANADAAEEPKTAAEQDEELKSNKVTLADLSAKGTALYVRKAYEESAECYAKAAEMQALLNGEMDPQNAEILFLYGRSLFKVGQSKSDVLGGKSGGGGAVAAEKPKKSDESAGKKEATVELQVKAGEGSGSGSGEKKEGGGVEEAKKPLFQFTGDENWDDSDEEEGGDEEQGDDEENDDLADAFEVLDLARVLFAKRLEELEAEVKDAADGGEHSQPTIKHVKERLADTHDLLAEISLENERYPNAIVDCRASLKYKKELYPFESEFVAEAHFKLSLALEFASITTATTTGEGGDEETSKRAEAVDQAMRDEAAAELQAAIDSTKKKLEMQEVELASTSSPEENEVTRRAIGEVKEVIADMEQRLIDLKKPPIDINETLYGEEGIAGAALGGLLAGARGAEAEAKVQEAKKNATDLSGLVRKKQKDDAPAPSGSEAAASTNGKRKAEDDAEVQGESGGASPKKARV